jgi:opacity protein-like surface antigen
MAFGGSIMTELRKFGPFAILIGYVTMYATGTKGVGAILPDIENITIAKLQAKWQNFAIAAGAGVAIYLIQKMKFNATIKTIATIALYFIVGWQIATAIDPPAGMNSGTAARFNRPTTINPYRQG